MKILKNMIILIIMLLTFLISLKVKDNKVYYISLGDELSLGINGNNYESKGYSDYISEYLSTKNKLKFYTKKFSSRDTRITDIINKINDNEKININNKDLYIQNAINKANIITISAGINEILYKYSNDTTESYMYDYIDSCIIDLEKLIKLVKKYNNHTIYILGYYNPTDNKELDKYIIYANDKLLKLCNQEKVKYVNLHNIFKHNKNLIYRTNNYYPNEDGYKLISNEIIKTL